MMENRERSHLDSSEDIVVPTPAVRCIELTDGKSGPWRSSSDLQYCVLGSDGLFNALKKEVLVSTISRGIANGQSGEDICGEVIGMVKS